MNTFAEYLGRFQAQAAQLDVDTIQVLATALRNAWIEGRQVFLCGNGGSAANAIHIANDLLYGIGKGHGPGLRVQALSANQAIMTCLANDLSYEQIFAAQLAVLGQPGDILIVLSGSGNSPNILAALASAKERGMATFAILGYSGGRALALADAAVHVRIDDMQIAEDFQLIVCHMVMQWLNTHAPSH